MKKFDRFDFEQQIMACWNVTSDVKTVTEYLLDAPLDADREDKIANMLLGIESLYEAKFDKLFRQFETLVHEHSHVLDRDSAAIDEFNEDQIRKFAENHPWTDEQLNRVDVDLEKHVNGINEENFQQELKL